MTIEHVQNLHPLPGPAQSRQPESDPISLAKSGEGQKPRSTGVVFKTMMSEGMQRLLDKKVEMQQALGIEGIRLFNDDGAFELRIMRPFEPPVPLLDLLELAPGLPPATAVLGWTEDGKPLTHTFSSDAPANILISGQESAGKTVLLRTIAASLALTSSQAQVQLLVVNPVSSDRERHEEHESALRPLSYLPHMLTDIAVRQTEITELLLFLTREMDYRRKHHFSLPRIVVLIDQAATVLEHGGRTVKQAMQEIAERGSQTGIYLVLSTRRPSADAIGPDLLANLTTHFVGKLDSNLAAGKKATAMETEAAALLGQGDFLNIGNQRGGRFQAAYIECDDMHSRMTQIYRQRPILLAQPLDTQADAKQKAKEAPAPVKDEQLAFLDDLAFIK